MKTTRKLLTTLILSLFAFSAYAQETETGKILFETEASEEISESPKRHIVKINLPSLIVTTFSFQYEFFPTSFMSLNLGYKFTPKRNMVFEDKVIDLIEDSSGADDLDSPGAKFFSNFKFNGNAITPEIRFYLGQGYGKGFFLGPFIRFDNYKFSSIYPFEGFLQEYDIDFDGKVKGFGYGLNIGAQHRLGKNFTLDWYLGPYLSNLKIDFNSKSNYTMSDEEVDELREELQDFEMPNGKTEIYADNNSVRAKLTSDNFFNLRFGLGIGYRF